MLARALSRRGSARPAYYTHTSKCAENKAELRSEAGARVAHHLDMAVRRIVRLLRLLLAIHLLAARPCAESSIEIPRPALLRSSTRPRRQTSQEPKPAATPGKGTAKNRGGTRQAAAPGAGARTHAAASPAPSEMTCAVESPYFFGAGRMKKWRGCCTSAEDILAQLVRHFGLADAKTAAAPRGGGGLGSVLLQFYDRELSEYIDLEDSSWQDFLAQVLARAPPPRASHLDVAPCHLACSLARWSARFRALSLPCSLARALSAARPRAQAGEPPSFSCHASFSGIHHSAIDIWGVCALLSLSFSLVPTHTHNFRPLSKFASYLARSPDASNPERRQKRQRRRRRG